MQKIVHAKNFEQWSGLTETYHNSRPVPPETIKKIILSWLRREPDVVVDVGCGTGLSTTVWDGVAKSVIGIEPNDDMRATAEKYTASDSIVYKKAVSNETGLPSDYADIITVSQAFHWMDIDSTLDEFYRILRKGGVLAIYDCELSPIIDWEIEKAYDELRAKCFDISYSRENPPVHNDKSSYKTRIRAFGKFRYSREATCHSVEKCTPQRVANFALTQGGIINDALEIDATIQKDIDGFSDLVKMRCANEFDIISSYKMVLAVK